MDSELFEELEKKLERLLEAYGTLRRENLDLKEENQRLLAERAGFRERLDAVLRRLDEV